MVWNAQTHQSDSIVLLAKRFTKVYHGLPFSPGIAICESAVSSDPILMGGPSGRKYSSLREATNTRHHSSLRSPTLAADLQHWPPSQRNVVRDVEKVWPVRLHDRIRFVKQVWEEWQVVPFDRILSLTHILHHINSYCTLNTPACKNNLCMADHWTSLPLSKALFLMVLRTTRICSHGVLGLTSQVIAVCQKTALV